MARQLRTLLHLGAVGTWTDGQLLERFLAAPDAAGELAFAALVERHGPMVLRVCRSILADPDAAQDAFQATFLVLVQRSRSLWVSDSLGPWLHQVARRVALAARSEAARRRQHERRAAERSLPWIAEPASDELREVESVLHREIARLPARYRVPLVLCDLEGQTHEQAARHLGCPVGTIKSRLSRGRDRLRDRLTRLGLAPAAVTAVVGSGVATASAAVPGTLVEATGRLAAGLVAGHAVGTVPAAVTLAEETVKAMMLAKIRILVVSCLVIATGLGAGVLVRGDGDAPNDGASRTVSPAAELPEIDPARAEAAEVHEVSAGPLRLTLQERGSLESSRVSTLTSSVEGQTTVLSIVPSGTMVKEGQIVAELDASGLKDRLSGCEIDLRRAEAALTQTTKALEAAQFSVREYLEGTFPAEEQKITNRITLARAEGELARLELERRKEAGADEVVILRATLALRRAELSEREASTELQVLREFTRERRVQQLESDVATARAEMFALEAAVEREAAGVEELRRQIEACVVRAPADGILSHAGSVEEGATVRERQALASVADLSRVRMNARVREALVDRVMPGHRARVRVDAFPEMDLSGVVKAVAPLPDATFWRAHSVKVYPTLIEIEDPPANLRPGMTAEAEIVILDLEDVLRVPTPAIFQSNGKDYVAVEDPDGGYAWREVTLGAYGGSLVEVKAGLRPGERVAIHPADLPGEAKRRATGPDEPPPHAPLMRGRP